LKKFNSAIQRGFTIIEIIMVIAIVGILSVIVISKINTVVTNLRLYSASEKMKEDIQYITDYAVSVHDTTWLVVNVNQNKYDIYSGPSALNRQLLIDPATNKPGEVLLDDTYPGVRLTAVNFAGGSEIFFDWWGTPSAGGTIVLNDTRSIIVTAETGFTYEN